MTSLYINGQWAEGHGPKLESINPADQSIYWRGQSANQNDVDSAIAAAKTAYADWRLKDLESKMPIFSKFKELLERDKEDFARILSDETGKPYWECLTEMGAMIGKLDISIKANDERCSTVSKDIPGATSVTRFRAIGPMVVFGPFNLPIHLPNGHIIPALIAGNTIVFKPSEQTPRCGEKMVQLWEEAGIPHGVINLVQGAKETGISLCANKDIKGVLFTGSYQTGAAIHKALAGRPEVILALEMGGNNPLVVWDCENIKAAAYLTIQSSFITSGQRCVCARRVIIPEGELGDKLLNELLAQSKKIRIGLPRDDQEPFMGPLISEHSAQLSLDAQKELEQKGGKVLLRMEQSERSPALVSPGIIDVTGVSNLDDEETFGPLLKVYRVSTFEEAVREADNTEYGLSAGLVSDRIDNYETFRKYCRAGIINWNRQITGAVSSAPFGGSGKSGNFRPGASLAADYCATPVASIECDKIIIPETLPTGIEL